MELAKQLELYKEKVRVFEVTKDHKTNYFNEYIEADLKAKHLEQVSQTQFVHDRDMIRDLEKQRDDLDLHVVALKRETNELQKTQLILKQKMSENEDKYHDTVLDLKEKVKKNVDAMLKIGNSAQGMFMLGPTPMSFYDSKVKHGLGYANPYTLKKAVSQNPKLYNASCLDNSKVSMNVRDFVPQKELSAEQTYFLRLERENIKLEYQKLFDSIKKTRAQTQGEINELIENVQQKTYAYADVCAQNQDLLTQTAELKLNLKNVAKGKSVNTKFDKDNVSKKPLCVTPFNKQVFQKKTVTPKIEEKHVLSKIVTLHTLPNQQQAFEKHENVIV
ncbi:hypothetical protein Tco_1345276 [Tanacetum coccineum]